MIELLGLMRNYIEYKIILGIIRLMGRNGWDRIGRIELVGSNW